LQPLAKAILARQNQDGGWSQLDTVRISDAYATGQTIVALMLSGVLKITDPAYRGAITCLLSAQREDGSWWVRSRSLKFQPYFESGFPYGHDQWISSMATGWAAAALAFGVEMNPKKAAE